MKIAVIADQHGGLPPIPQCDLMIVSGDMCGGPDYVDGRWRPDISDRWWRTWIQNEFMDWARQVQYTVFVGGNHDTCLLHWAPTLPPSVNYLCDSGCEVDGLKLWGAPWIKQFDELAFNLPEQVLGDKWGRIPSDTDILVCHGPPCGTGDLVGGRSTGSPSLRGAIVMVEPRLVTCGHIHEGRGIYNIGRTKVVNAACGFIEVEV